MGLVRSACGDELCGNRYSMCYVEKGCVEMGAETRDWRRAVDAEGGWHGSEKKMKDMRVGTHSLTT